MVLSVAKLFRLEKALEYFSGLEKIVLFTTKYLGVVYLISQVLAVFVFEKAFYAQRLTNQFYTLLFFVSILYLFLITQLFWFKRFSKSYLFKFIAGFSFVFSFEKYVIVVTSFHREFLSKYWVFNSPIFDETIGFIITIFALFILNRTILKNN